MYSMRNSDADLFIFCILVDVEFVRQNISLLVLEIMFFCLFNLFSSLTNLIALCYPDVHYVSVNCRSGRGHMGSLWA